MSVSPTLPRAARLLETAVLSVAVAGLVFRVAGYARFTRPAGAAWGTGDVIDFGIVLLLFLLSTACAACGVAISLRGAADGRSSQAAAYRPLLVGVTTFVAYYFLAPRLPSTW